MQRINETQLARKYSGNIPFPPLLAARAPIPRPPSHLSKRPKTLTGAVSSDVLSNALLNYFSLSDRDAADLTAEYEISRERLERHIGVRSAPSSTALLFTLVDVLKDFPCVDSWPSPFHFDGEALGLHAPTHGLIVPAWRGHFRAWQHYKNAKDDAPRWISSSHLPRGSKAEASIHVVKPMYARHSRACVLVSHTLEAEAVAGGGIVSVAAVNGLPPYTVARQLREVWPGLRAVTLDFDGAGSYVREFHSAGLKAEVSY